jgi:hypothetical protein
MYRCNVLLLATITWYLENNIDLPDINGDFLRECLQLVGDSGGSATKNIPQEVVTRVYSEVFGNQKIKHSGIAQINSYSIISYYTMLENYNKFAIESHISMYLVAKYFIQKGHANWLAGVILKNTKFITIPKTIRGDLEYWTHVQHTEREIYESYISNDSTTKNFIKYRYHMLSHIIQDNHKRFSLIPLYKECSKFITLDDFAIELLRTKVLRNTPKENKESVKTIFSSLDTFFVRPHRNKWNLGSMVSTNGYELHIQYVSSNYGRTKSGKLSKLPIEKQTEPEHWDPSYRLHSYNGESIVAIDPGHYNVFTTYESDGTHKTITKEEFSHRSHRNLLNKKVAYLSRNLNLNYPTLCTHVYQNVVNGIRERIANQETVLGVFSSRAYYKAKFDARIHKQKEIDRILNWISNNNTKVLAFGDGSRFHGFHGTSPGGPVTSIRRYARKKGYRTFMVDESYTSCRMSCCKTSDAKHPRKENGEPVHGLYICQKCYRVWNRDYNASRNILRLAQCVVTGEPRPLYLKKLTDTMSPNGVH